MQWNLEIIKRFKVELIAVQDQLRNRMLLCSFKDNFISLHLKELLNQNENTERDIVNILKSKSGL